MAAGIQVPLLRHLVDPRTPFRRGFEVEGATIRLAINAVCGLSGELLAKCLAPGGTILTCKDPGLDPPAVNE